ncbi:hypothetical protein J3Q64DRAFT_1754914 [Phycomyces blakesleeanus]|uniref:Uncharacterized protein n=2 Tax=Phycomyces blakesleeanus TaxID=4837 RepID=A0A167JX67_PHYB8|nr:hypothetical protein PHYBLDRAFT_152113 [Phycomyces blakesleeanus NRRL 1555(-)]OAD66849.1 hypothetical protein PHYBLDRAFT_152113 [Phycomyces blakesleeanus NRRL 1555(-)]|eukprot:XP_018284889.1 hypothetical protein PHYBLDRAFT_152113 [Phycomyces blakesleeanus NRRL 1555(-)]
MTHKRQLSTDDMIKKKPRSTKSVRFIDQPVIYYTYSASDYNRAAESHVLYKLNPRLLPQLSVDIPTYTPTNPTDPNDPNHQSPSPDSLASPETPSDSTSLPTNCQLLPLPSSIPMPHKISKKDRPRLSINTTMCAGPLFFTRLSTHPSKRSIWASNTPDDEDDSSYLVPISATVL